MTSGMGIQVATAACDARDAGYRLIDSRASGSAFSACCSARTAYVARAELHRVAQLAAWHACDSDADRRYHLSLIIEALYD